MKIQLLIFKYLFSIKETACFFLLIFSLFLSHSLWGQCVVDAGPNVPICLGSSTQLNATPDSSTWSYFWNSVPAGSYPNTRIISVTPTSTTTYIVNVISQTTGYICSDTVIVNVNNLPAANFSFSPNTPQCSPVTVQFTNLSNGGLPPYSYAWNFEDPSSGNNTSTSQNPTHTFIPTFGGGTQIYNVSLIVTDANLCASLPKTLQVSVKQIPDASIADVFGTWKHCVVGSIIAYTLEINNTSTTTATNTHYHIDWGDLSVPFDSVILPNGTSHQYTTIGNFPVILTVTNIQCSATKTYYFFNGSTPYGGIVNPGNTQGLCGIPQVIIFTFDVTTANNPAGTIYTISYDDGSPNEVYSQPPPATVSHTFTFGSCGHASPISIFPNSFAIRCITSNPCGQATSVIDPIQISNKPIPSFNPDPLNNGCINMNITFTSTTSPVGFVDPGTNICTSTLIHTWLISPTTYTIVSGDLHSTNLTVKFNTTGFYTVTLTESNGCASDLLTKSICITQFPIASFTVNTTNGCKPLIVIPNNTSTSSDPCGTIAYTWSITSYTGSPNCLPNSSSYSISNPNAANPTITLNNPGIYRINLAVQNGCGTATAFQDITVKRPPSVQINTIPSICAGQSISPTANFYSCWGTLDPSSYVWTFTGGVPGGANSPVPGSISYANPGTYPISVSVSNECGLGNSTSSVLVKPLPVISATPLNQTICSGASTQTVTLNSTVAGTTYTWTTASSVGTTGAPANGNGTPIPAWVLTNSNNTPGTVTITITPTANGCTGTPITHIITVKPKPSVSNSPLSQTVCSGDPTALVTLTSNVTGTTFTWTATPLPATLTGYTASGTSTIPVQTIINPTTSNGTVTYAIMPTANGCTGTVVNYVITVKPIPNVSNTPLNKTICSGTNTSITLTSNVTGTTFGWTASCITGTVTGFTATGSGNINDVLNNTDIVQGTVRYVITPTANGCSGTPVNFDVNVQPVPVATATPLTQEICAGSGTTAVTLSSNVTGTSFSWSAVASPPSGMTGYTASGSGVTIPVMTINSTLSGQGTITYTITPSIGTCNGTPGTHIITVNPAPSVTNNPMSQSICSGNQTALVTLTSNVSGTTFTWTATAPGTITGWTASGGNTIPVQTLLNTTNTPGNVTYHIIPSSNTGMNCPGQPADYIITVKPIPVASANASQTICSGASTQAVSLSSTVTGTTYSWTTVATGGTTGAPANGTGTPIPAWTLTNSTITAGTVTITITPTANGCIGTPITHVITVNPTPVVTSVPTATQIICSNDSTNIVLSASVSSSVISWTALLTSGTITGFSNGSGNLIKQKLINTGIVSGIVTYSITATANGCTGPVKSIAVTVNPIPNLTTIPSPNQEICSNSSTNITLNSNVTGTSINWVPILTSGNATGFSSGVGSPIVQTLINSSNTIPAVVTYTITPVFGGCTGNIINFPVTVNPLPITNAGTDQSINYGTSTTLTGTSGGGTGSLTYIWTPAGSIVPPNTTLIVGTTNLYTSPTTFTLLTTDSKGCSQSDQMTVTLSGSALSVSVTAVPNVICIGESSQLIATGSGGSGSYTYSWTCNPGTWSSSISNPIVSPVSTTSYTVVVNDGFNTASASVNLVVNPLPIQYPVTGGGAYCSGGSGVPVGVQNSQNGVVYKLYKNLTQVGLSVNGNGGPISFGNQTAAGTYFVKGTTTSTGCLNIMTDSAVVIILPLPTQYLVTGGGSYPAGGSGVLIGLSNSQTGVEYELAIGGVPILPRVAGTGSPISFGLQTVAGNYTVTAYSLTSPVCTSQMLGSATVFINQWPTAFNVFGGGSLCADDTTGVPIGLDGSEIGVNYQLKRDGINYGAAVAGTGDSLMFGFFTLGTVYTVIGTNILTNLTIPMNGSATVIINPLPIPYVMGSYGDNCPGSEIMLNGSQLGANYVLRLNLNPLQTLPGTGIVLNFGPQSLPGDYTVYAYFVVTGCDTIMDGMITINPSPDIYDVRPPGVSCAGDTVSITGSQLGIIYQLQRDGLTNVGSPLPGTGLPISFGPQTVAGIYSVLAINPLTNCKIFMNGTANLNPLPNLFSIVPSGDTCAGVSIGLSGSQLGMKYILKRDTLWMDTLNGTGGPLEFGIQTIPGIYTIVGYDTTTFKFCSNLMLGSTILHPGPIQHAIIPSGFNCAGDSIGLANSDMGVIYQLILNGNQNAGSPVAGTGGPIWFGIQNYPGTYTIVGRNTATNCSSMMTGTCILTPLPVAYNIFPQGDTCAGTPIGINGSQTGVNYILMRDNIPVMTLSGTGGILSFGPQTISGAYIIKAYNVTPDTCISLMNGSLIILPLPLAYNITPQGANCEPTIIGISGSQVGVNYELIKNGLSTGIILPGTGSALSFSSQLAGVYTVTGRYMVTPNCHNLMAGTVVVNAPPMVDAGPNDSVCHSAITYQISATGSEYSTITWTSSGDGFFTNANALNAIYHLGVLDRINGLVNLTIMVTGTPECPGSNATDMMTLIIDPLPVANAGPDISLCQGQVAQLNGSAQNYSTVQWTSTGNGLFSNNSILNPTYTPGTGDLQNGIFKLILTAYGSLTCQSEIHRDTLVASIYPLPTATISGSASICEADTASIVVHLTGTPPWSITYTDGVSTTTVSNIGSNPFILQVNPVVTTSYSLTAIHDAHCEGSSFTGTATIGVFPKPIAYTITVTNGGGYCEGGQGVEIGLDNSQTGIKYYLLLGGIQFVNSIAGTGFPLSFGLFTTPGLYTIVGIDTTTAAHCSRQMSGTATIVVNPLPIVDFHADTACLGQPTQFILTGLDIGKIANWYWDFGDGTTAFYNFLFQPTHIYPTYGNYQVTLQALDTNGCERQIVHNIHVMPLPVSLFAVSTPTCQGLTVTFTDYSYSIPSNITYLITWIWNFGDGSTDTIHFPASPNVTHQYLSAGNYQVTLKVINNFGCINQHSLPVTITPNPVANFFYGSNQCADQAVQFTDGSQLNGGGAIIGWQWNFGDPTSGINNTSMLQNPLHVYAQSGTYSVNLIISSSSGCPDTIVKNVQVQMKPKALFTANSPCQGNVTNFYDQSIPNSMSIISWDWNFGDGFPHSNLQNPVHLYVLSGQYNVTLSITNSNQCTHDTTITVHVIPLPLASYQSDAPKCLGSPVYYSNLSTSSVGQIVKWHWNFGDGTDTMIFLPGVPNVSHVFIGTALQHLVRLTVTTNDSCSDYYETTIQSIPTPVANFSYSSTLCSGQIVQFTDQTQLNGGGVLTGWLWNFDDPTSGTQNISYLQNPVHAFTSAGIYNVTLTATNVSCPNTISKPITINPQPVADFSADTACFGTPTHFQDQTVPNAPMVVSWDWNFGDGSPHAYIANPIHLYTASGTYSVTLTVTNSNGCIQSKTKNVMVLPSPTASFVYSTNNCSGTPVQFTDQSTAASGYIVQWIWDFGDGNITTVNLPAPPNVSHVYASGGTYNVTLTVKTADSCTASVSHMVTVTSAPVANFDYPAIRCAGMAVQFTDLSQQNGGGTIMNWEWNFGDPGTGTNNFSTQQNPFHVFSNGGTYQVQLIITNTSTCKDTIVKTVGIDNKPSVDFTFDTVCKGDITHFTDASVANTGSITNWLWSFGDGTTSIMQNPVHQYSTSGLFQVVLTVTNSAGCSHDTTKMVQVKVKPSAAFSFAVTCKGSLTQFHDLSTTSNEVINQWQWDFGDGGSSSIQNPSHTYSTSGIFNVTLIVSNSSGCSDSITLPVTINPTPTAQYGYYNTYCPAGRVDFFDQSTAANTSIVSWFWEFEPGFYSNAQNPVYSYSQTNANYPVMLIVTDGNGCRDTIVDTVFVKPGFQLAMLANDTCLGNPNQFHAINQASADPLHNFTWNFGESGSFTNTSSLKDPQHTYANSGTYFVTLKAWNSDNCVDSVYKMITVYPGSIADFSYNPGTFCTDTTVIFTNLSSGNGTSLDSLIYTFGDGTSAIKTAPFSNPDTVGHHYSAFGTYTVMLTAINTNGCRSVKSRQVLVTCMTTSFTMADTIICQNSLLVLTDNSTPQSLIKKWYWDFGDGLDTTYFIHCNTVKHNFQQPGFYNIKLVISTTVSGITISDSSTRQVLVKVSPVANFSSVSVCLGDSSKFIDLSDSSTVSIISHYWKFGDQLSGTNDTSTLTNPVHKYTHYGNFSPKLIVQNAVGCADSMVKSIKVHKLPVAAFLAPDLLCSRTYIELTDKSIAGDTTKLSWLWHLGDTNDPENISIEQNPLSYYDSEGTYDIFLRIRDAFGCRDSITNTINVLPSPVSSFIAEENLDGIAGKVRLTNTSQGAIAYLWNFGNGQTSRKKDPDVINYEDNGTYIINLIASADNKCTDTTSYEIEILFRALYVPNAFAPLTTDVGTMVFKPVGVGLKEYHVQVFDTWGHLLWESVNLDPGGKPVDHWDGKDQGGNLMPQGTYMWKISASFIDGTIWQGSDNGKTKGIKRTIGTVTLIR